MLRRLIKRRWLVVLLGAATTLVVVLGMVWRSAIKRNRSVPDEPFRIAGNLYYVGATGVTAFLLTGPEGHVLIDGGYLETAPLIIGSIAKLGFDIADVRMLLNTHAHSDHAGGLRALQEASGAELWVSEGDADVMAAGRNGDDPALGPLRFIGVLGFGTFPAPRIDHRFKNGATIRLGPLELTAHVTAGHTRGCTSWSFPVRDGDRELLAVDICSLTLFPFVSLVEPEAYPGIRSDFERSFSTLRSLPADIFLASHADMFSMQRKLGERADAKNPADPFIDRAGYLGFIGRAEARFREVLAKQQ
ncbi:MAG: subclass B3 metallo-beta-lactamase [Gemmatimonadetes bacterium]|nr:subclass B3 metallo-beta-lactamase [Gemmatimonadota bacterium]